MKTLILLLLLPMFATAQFTEQQIEAIYDAVKQGEMCKEDLKTAFGIVYELQGQINDLSGKMKAAADTIEQKNSELEELQKRPNRKWVTFGPTVVVMPDLKIAAGLGLTFNIFSF